MDVGVVGIFLNGLWVYLDDLVKVKKLLFFIKIFFVSIVGGKNCGGKGEIIFFSFMNLFMGVKVF